MKFFLSVAGVPYGISCEANNGAQLVDQLLERAAELMTLRNKAGMSCDITADCTLSVALEHGMTINRLALVENLELRGNWLPCYVLVEIAKGKLLHQLLTDPDRVDERCDKWCRLAIDLLWVVSGPNIEPLTEAFDFAPAPTHLS